MSETLRRYAPALVALACGVLETLAYAPYDQKWVGVFALVGLVGLALSVPPARAFRLGWLFAFAHFCTGIYWIYVSTHVFGGAPAWLAIILFVLLHGYMALYTGFAMWVTALAVRRARWLPLLVAPAAWLVAEFLREWVFTGFPWLFPGYFTIDTPLAPLATFIGVHGLSFLVVLIATAGAMLILDRGRPWPAWAALLLVVVAAAAARMQPVQTRDTGTPISVAIVQGQGEVLMNEKWQPANRSLLVDRFRTMTLDALDAQLVVWPEGPIPATYRQMKDYYLPMFDQAFKERGAVLVAGVLREAGDGSKAGDGSSAVYNSSMLLGAGTGRYDKRHLVPFGEFFPIPDWLRPMMDVLGTPFSDFAFGAAEQPPLTTLGQTVFINICFEDVFADEFRRNAQGATLLINQTNDSWFGSAMAPWQHLQIARMRALENGRWFIRATNSGVSALIGPDGRVAARTKGTYEVATLRGAVQPRTGLTWYARVGDAPWRWGSALLVVATLLPALRDWRRGRRDAAPSATGKSAP